VVEYLFLEGSGSVVGDSSGFGVPLDLTVDDVGAVSWVSGGGLSVDSPTLITSGVAASKVIDAVVDSGEITVELWVDTADITQWAPARMVSISADSLNQNMVVGQGSVVAGTGDQIEARMRTTATTSYGYPATVTSGGFVDRLMHVVFTRTAGGATVIYLDGVPVETDSVGGSLSVWDPSYPLNLANEFSQDRPWLGEFCLVAIYDQVLDASGVDNNYQAGCPTTPPANRPPVFNQDLRDRTDPEGAQVNLGASAFDPDTDPILYGEDGLPPGLSIDSNTGLISGAVAVDASLTSPYDVTITAADGEFLVTDTFQWTIVGQDADSPVVESGLQLSVAGGSPIGTEVGRVIAIDNLAVVSFAVSGGTGTGVFDIDETGMVTLVDPSQLDFPTNPVYSLLVVASDAEGNESPSTEVTIVEEGFGWQRLSSQAGDLPAPANNTAQASALVLDVDRDGDQDFALAARQPGPALVWYQRTGSGWVVHVIEDSSLNVEAGGTFFDIDRDGDLDIVVGGEYDPELWWWENPYPSFDPGTNWTRHSIHTGNGRYHDQLFGDFDGDGQTELAFWNQNLVQQAPGGTLYVAEIPADPAAAASWPATAVYSWSSGEPHEGLASGDLNGDGKIELLGGGLWFEHTGGATYLPHVIDINQRQSRVAVAQLVEGGPPEVVLVGADTVGPLVWYELVGGFWEAHQMMPWDVDHGHSLDVGDVDGDGHLDLAVFEMRFQDGNEDAKMWLFMGDGTGGFARRELDTGVGHHQAQLGDLDNDGDLDILTKPWDWDLPRLDVWLQDGSIADPALPLDQWQRHVIDPAKPARSVFITPADLDDDGYVDLVTGAWWYRNPGAPDGNWVRTEFGDPLNNMAAVADFDGDGDPDIVGTQGDGSDIDPAFAWARNEGDGAFTTLTNLESGSGDFLQGVALGTLENGLPSVAVSWHAGGPVEALSIPSDPSTDQWVVRELSPSGQAEQLSAADIDRDGDTDLLLGTIWLRNEGSTWSTHSLTSSTDIPDRNRLADVNQDGRLDAIVGFEDLNSPDRQVRVTWFEQPVDPTGFWLEHVIDVTTAPMSLDVADMDDDGDLDVVVGEHEIVVANGRLFVYENADGFGETWVRHLVYTGDEHHDGSQAVDIDADGDLDIVSIGWFHNRVLVYENLAIDVP
jgi:hypothetical protein